MSGFWGGQPRLLHPGYVSGRRYVSAINGFNNVAMAANSLRLCVYEMRAPGTFSGIGLNVTTGSAGLAKAGIYAFNVQSGATLIAEANADMDTTSIAQISASFAANVTLPAGIYLTAVCFNATPTVTCQTTSGIAAASLMGGATYAQALSNGLLVTGYTYALSYVSGPTPFFPAAIPFASLVPSSANAPPVCALLAA